ncbi:MAG TPA: FAD-binding oxidoreductase [Coleofasciculaceae cyanobacterium]
MLTIAQITNNDAEQMQPLPELALASAQPRYWSSGEIIVRCIQVIAETHDVKTFRFVAKPPVLFSYQPGQFVTLDLEIEGKRVKRPYSISSTPSRPHILEITVKRVLLLTGPDTNPGLVSNWLHDRITVDSQVKLTGPMGKFTCVDHAIQKLLFISVGSGITPMMSMCRWLCDRADVDIVFIYSARSLRDFIFRYELESMAARYDNFKLAVTITRSELGQVWQGYTGRLNEFMLQAIAPDVQERSVYVCGANPLMKRVKTMLETLGLPMESYHQESFGGSKKRLPKNKSNESKATVTLIASRCSAKDYQKSATQNITGRENTTSVNTTQDKSLVVFAESGKEICCDREEFILDITEQEGMKLASVCRMGACGACKLPLLAE